ncbi:MAG: hypothetical protein RMJ98_12240 [Myxococcales bacterium]|nr:hypothetical protein [Polyangiaceae bacterium]MDW8250057.1 hypothetical protein [Myxococcales bacterium]
MTVRAAWWMAVGWAVVVLAGCSKGPQERLQGKWVGDSISNIPPEQEARATGWVRHTSFLFEGDKMTVALPAGESRTGVYKVERANGNKVTLKVDRGNGEVDEAVLTMINENAFQWDIGNERSVKFTRVVSVQ